MKIRIDLFTPAEAAQISGVSMDNQRNLRRAGYLPKNKGHARFSLIEVCRLLVFGMMSERGIGPKVATTFADTAARGILLRLLWNEAIYSVEAGRAALAETKEETDASIENVKKERGDLVDDESENFLRQKFALRHLSWLVEAHLGMFGEEPPSLFVYWPNDFPEFFYGEDVPFGDCDYSIAAWQGPAIMFSIGAVAYLLASRLPHPVIHLENESNLSTSEGQQLK